MDHKKFSFNRSRNYKDKSKQRLSSIMKKKIQTTMIGAISSIEDHFGMLWNGDSKDHALMHEIFQKVRSEILDKGNHQLRNIDVELSQYDIEWMRYNLDLPMKQIKEDGNE